MKNLVTGFGTSDITPPIGVELSGFGWYIERKSTGIIEPLLARAMVWQAGETKGAIISCDLIGVTKELVEDVRTRVSVECRIPPGNILVCATHTHSGPAVVNLIGWGERDIEYLKTLPARIAASANSAESQMVASELEYGEAEIKGISFNREDKEGQIDSLLKVVKVKSNGKVTGFLVNYSCHPVVMCAQTYLISGDFIGLALNKVAGANGCTGLFLQGSCGDQNPIYRFLPQDEAIPKLHILSDRFAEAIEAALNNTQPVILDKISAARQEITLPQIVADRPTILRVLNLIDEFQKYNDSLPHEIQKRLRLEKAVYESLWKRYDRKPLDGKEIEIQAFIFGNIVIATHPAELFYGFHKKLQELLLPLKAIIVGYANDYIGYIPLPDRYDVSRRNYSYSAHFVPLLIEEFSFREDAGEILTDAMLKLVEKGL
ncbi:MAG: hypothetical protein FIA99_17185 [Ruminiclostridium sp.]|nr:hypothetical protein [Ruminiclostridium sp.]